MEDTLWHKLEQEQANLQHSSLVCHSTTYWELKFPGILARIGVGVGNEVLYVCSTRELAASFCIVRYSRKFLRSRLPRALGNIWDWWRSTTLQISRCPMNI